MGREQQISPLVKLNLNTKVNDEKFIELYSALPDEVKKIFVDTMSKLAQSAEQPKSSPRKRYVEHLGDIEDRLINDEEAEIREQKKPIKQKSTYTCGELEDIKKAEKIETEDAG